MVCIKHTGITPPYAFVRRKVVSADTVNVGLDRYGYVHGNPETFTDPSGHCAQTDVQGGAGSLQCGSGGGNGCGAYQTCPTNPNPTNPNPTPTPTPTSGGNNNGCGTCADVFQGWWHIGVGIAALLLLGGGILAACLGPLAISCGVAWKAAAPFMAQALRNILAGIDILHQLSGGRIGDLTSVLVRGAMVIADAITIVTSVLNLADAIKAFPGLLKSVAGFASAGEDALKTAQYADRIANAGSDAQRAALKGAETRLKIRVANEFAQSVSGIAGSILGWDNAGPDVDNFLQSAYAWSAS